MAMKRFAVLSAAAAAIALCECSTNAAVISWTANAVSGDSNVLNDGTVLAAYAYNYTYGTSVTVNGITFTSATGTSNPDVAQNFDSTYGARDFNTAQNTSATYSTAYKNLLQQCIYGSTSGTITLSNLTVGNNYQVELWVVDSGNPARNETLTGSPNVTLTYGSPGEYAVGTFTADGVTQTISLNSPTSIPVQVNAIDLIQVPEPATLSLSVVSAALLLGRPRRGRRKSSPSAHGNRNGP